MLIQRRRFLKGTVIAAASACLPAALSIAEPLKRNGHPNLKLSLAAYSFRNYLKDANHPRPEAAPAEKQIDLFAFVDYCAEQGCAAAELTSYYFPRNVPLEYILDLKRHCFLRAVEISGTAVGNTFTHPPGEKRTHQLKYVRQWIDFAAAMGAPHLRVFAGNAETLTKKEAMKHCISALEESCDYARQNGIVLGLENHGGIVAEPADLIEIVEAVQSKWLGINLDSANFQTEDPYADFEKCAGYAVNVQIKTEVHPKNRGKQPSDLKRYIDILKRANYQGYVALEYEAEEDPYTAVPKALKDLKQLMT